MNKETGKKEILLIIPYFGKTPPWIEYFIESCRYNPRIDWLLYGNLNIPSQIPNNIKVIPSVIDDFYTRIYNRLGIKIQLPFPYKICDFRPAFAELFQDLIIGYEFWGYCDLDLIFGNIYNKLVHHNYSMFDVVTTRLDSLAGHFTLYRNNDLINNMYKKIWQYRSALLKADRHFYLDERSNYIGQVFLTKKKNIFRLAEKVRDSFSYRIYKKLPMLYDITRVVERYEKHGILKLLRIPYILSDENFNKKNIQEWKVVWERGKLTDPMSGREMIYFHFIQQKHKKDFVIGAFSSNLAFSITSRGINTINPHNDNAKEMGIF